MNIQMLKNKIARGTKPILLIGAGATITSNGLGTQDIAYFCLEEYYGYSERAELEKMKYISYICMDIL